MYKKIMLLFFFLGILFLFWFSYHFLLLEDVIIYETDVYISAINEGGFNLDSDKLHFGLVPLNSPIAYRKIDFHSPYNESMRVEIDSFGTIAEFLSYEYKGEKYSDPFSFYLVAGENVTLKVLFSAEGESVVEEEYYDGKITVFVRHLSILDHFSFWVDELWEYYF